MHTPSESAGGDSTPPTAPGPAAATTSPELPRQRRLTAVFATGAAVGILGGMIGLGGAEFRLPLLISLFGFAALQAVIVNKALSLVVVASALPARLAAVPLAALTPHWTIVANLLAGSIIGAWLGAGWATRMRSTTLYRVLAALLVLIAATLAANHLGTITAVDLPAAARVIAGLAAGVAIGAVAALMGVAGGELLIPTIAAWARPLIRAIRSSRPVWCARTQPRCCHSCCQRNDHSSRAGMSKRQVG